MYSDEVIDRLESALSKTLPRWGLPEETGLSLLSVSENAVFRARDRSAGLDLVFRVHRQGYHTLVEIGSELAWLAALNEEGTIDTLTPVLQESGDLVGEIDDAGAIWHVVAFNYLPGRQPDAASGLMGWFERLGAITARLHDQSRNWERPRGFVRKVWNFDTTLGDNPLWGDWRAALGLTPDGYEVLQETAELLRHQLAAYGEDPEKFGLIHADLRLANLIVNGEQLSVIDFDDCGFSWYMYDFAAAISFLEHEPYVPELLDAWLTGYCSVAPLSDEDVEMIPVFIMLRRMLLTAWIASHSEIPTARQLGEAYTHGTVALARAFLAEYAEGAEVVEQAEDAEVESSMG